jgi:xanthine dehydrogenase YagR molybdenum-binding subunit
VSIGQPLTRADGPAKVTGGAHYTADTPVPGLAHAALVLSPVPHGHVVGIDDGAALAAPGVLAVLTHENAPRVSVEDAPSPESWAPLQDDLVRHEGQALAVVVADTLERAQHAARLVRVEVAPEPAPVELRGHLDEAVEVPDMYRLNDTRTGDVGAALREAEVTVRGTYRTADRHHSPIETAATIASWEDGRLDLRDATQWVFGVRAVARRAFGLGRDGVRVRNEFVGGGFGCKGYPWLHRLLAAMAARAVGRPAKLVLTRAQSFTLHGHQPATEQVVELGARRDGTLVAIRHACVSPTSLQDDYVEMAAVASRTMYACPAIETTHRVVRLARNLPTPMRAPHQGPGMVGLDIAMDELAYALGIDPLELRLRNYAETDPTSGLPFSSNRLRDCYRLGAERFGWHRRPMAPGSMRDGRDLVGWGMACALMHTVRMPASARVTIDRDGEVLVESGTQEIGTGVRTVMPQIAADALGVPRERVRIVLGDTTLPPAGGTFGSSTTLSVGSAVQSAARRLRADLDELAGGPGVARPDDYARLLAEHDLPRLAATGEVEFPADEEFAMQTFGAVFAEVRVDADLRLVRVSRLVGVYSAGRIINPLTARSQMTGGMVWGIGQALLESSDVDPVLGRYLSKNLAGYLVPVNADVPALEARFVEDEVDERASPLGAKGVGELGAVGVAPAIANAVFHATGVRVREVPIRPEMLL